MSFYLNLFRIIKNSMNPDQTYLDLKKALENPNLGQHTSIRFF
ncbi:hypothetical protein LEP1GSC024_2776 [Leptospira noguchii str. 2001034031]|uniref:Uncharacterized protein n=1 Tax=Leptospira noguchii str. 2001034031 TaxID=1193053 RepID=M6Y111_9LEPT|nr:hypothetical protein LEP1GSC024_2776 [Leptospira noguchii str. 2001034031]